MVREAIIEKIPSSYVLMAGSLEDRSLLDIVTEIEISKHSGVLKITDNNTEYRLFFREGALIYADNSKDSIEHCALSMIKKSGIISMETIIKSERKKNTVMKTLLETLIDDGKVSIMVYSKIINAVVRTHIIRALLRKNSNFIFETRMNVNEVQGIKPVTLNDIKSIEQTIFRNPDEARLLINSLYTEVISSEASTPYLSSRKSFIHSFLMTEYDFSRFFSMAVADYAEKKWSLKSKSKVETVLENIALYSFRTFTVIVLLVFFYLIAMTQTFDIHNDNYSRQSMFFLRIRTIQSITLFESGQKKSVKELLESGNVRRKDLDFSKINVE